MRYLARWCPGCGRACGDQRLRTEHLPLRCGELFIVKETFAVQRSETLELSTESCGRGWRSRLLRSVHAAVDVREFGGKRLVPLLRPRDDIGQFLPVVLAAR